MAENKFKDHSMDMPIEKHDTAAWADIKDTTEISKVGIPSQQSIRDAKDWVDANEK